MGHHHPAGGATWITALYYGSGIDEIVSPWLRVLVLLAVLAIWFSAVAGLAVWIYRRSGVGLTGVGLLVAVLVGAGGLTAAFLFGEIGQRSGLGREPWFLAFWVVLLALSVTPLVYIFWRGGLLKDQLRK